MSQVKVGIGPGDSRINKPMSSGSGSSAPTNAQYVVLTTNATLTQERVLTAGTGVSIVDAGAGSTVTISLSGASVPAGTEQYQHLEWSGAAWGIVDHLTLGTASTPSAELRLRSTTNRIYASGASVMVIDSPRIDIHESGGLIARFDGSALQMQSTNSIQFNTTSQKIAANGTDRIDYTAPTSHDFRIGATLYARIEANAFSLDPTDGSFIPIFDSSVAGALRLFDGIGASEILRWTGTYQRMAGTNTIQFNASTEYIGCPLLAGDLYIGSSDTVTAKPTTSFFVNIGVIDVMEVNASGITLDSTSNRITTAALNGLELNGGNGAVMMYNTGDRVRATSAGVTLFDGAAGVDYTITLDGETNNCVLKWREDEDYLEFQDDVLLNGTERIYFEDTNQYIYSPSAAVLSIVAADSSGIINITASGTSAEVNIQATSNLSVRINDSSEYFVFDRAAQGSNQQSRLTFYCYDNDRTTMDEACDIRGYVVEDFDNFEYRMRCYVDDTEMWRLTKTVSNLGAYGYSATLFPSSATSGIVFTDGANSTHDLMYTGNTVGLRIKSGGAMQIQAAGYTSQINLIIPDGLSNERNFFFTVNSAGTTGTLCYSSSTFVIGGSSVSGRTLTLANDGGGTFTCNIVSSSEWSFTSTSLTIGGGNNVVLNTGTGTQWGTGNTQKQAWWGATAVGQSTGWGCSNVTTDKGLDCNSTTLDEVADVLGSLIDQLKTYGLLGA